MDNDNDNDMPSPREALGLDLASEGDPRGIERFLSWAQRELYSLAHLSHPSAPSELRDRLASLAHEAENVLEFTRGYIAAQQAVTKQ